MKYEFEEQKIYGGYILRMHLEDVPTLKGSTSALESTISDMGTCELLIKDVNKVLSGKEVKIDSGTNAFWYTITPKIASFTDAFDRSEFNFTISPKVLLEVAVIWENRLNEFCKKYKY